MKNIGSYSYGIHTHMDTSNFGKKMQYAYGTEHTHMEFILISAAAHTGERNFQISNFHYTIMEN